MFGPKPLLFAEFETVTFSNGSIAKRTRPNESLRRTNSPRRHIRFPISQDRSLLRFEKFSSFYHKRTLLSSLFGQNKKYPVYGYFLQFPISGFASGIGLLFRKFAAHTNCRHRRCGKRRRGDGEELYKVVVGRDTVGTECAAFLTAMDDRPFAAAGGGTVAGDCIQMQTVETIRTVVPVTAAGTLRRHPPAAYLTEKAVFRCAVICRFMLWI